MTHLNSAAWYLHFTDQLTFVAHLCVFVCLSAMYQSVSQSASVQGSIGNMVWNSLSVNKWNGLLMKHRNSAEWIYSRSFIFSTVKVGGIKLSIYAT